MTDHTNDDTAPALFDVAPSPAAPTGPGRVELELDKALKAAWERQTLIDEDRGLIGGALAAARAIDNAERIGGLKGGYLIAQALTPYREALHALRLPAAVNPAEQPRGAAAAPSAVPDWLGDQFGTPST